MPERRVGEGGWRDPRLYVAILSTLLGLFLWLATRISSQLDSINTAVQSIAISSATQKAEIEALERRMSQLERDVPANEKTQRDYNYNLSTRVSDLKAAIEASSAIAKKK